MWFSMKIIPFAMLGKIIRGNPLMVLILKFEVKKFFLATKNYYMGLNENWRMGY